MNGIEVHYGTDIVNPEYVWSYPEPESIRFHQKRAVEQGADSELVRYMNGYTGAVAVIDSGKPGPVCGFRVDIDCVSVDETKDEEHRPNKEGFASVNPGCMHACGHDGHTTMGLFLAAILQKNRDQFHGKVKIIFQPGEEGDKGAQSLVEKGILEDVDVLFAMHIMHTDQEYPALAGTWQGLYATTKFDIEFLGQSAHAGIAPENGNNAILAAVNAVQMMNGFMQDGRGSSRLNIGTIHGGTGRNVVPDYCKIEAETRGSDTDVEKRLYDAVVRSAKNAADSFNCESKVTIKGYCPTGNGDPDLAEAVVRATEPVKELQWRKTVQDNTGGTDDFAYMMKYMQSRGRKACYMNLFTKLQGGLHSSHYDMDECCLKAGVKSYLAVFAYLQQKQEFLNLTQCAGI